MASAPDQRASFALHDGLPLPQPRRVQNRPRLRRHQRRRDVRKGHSRCVPERVRVQQDLVVAHALVEAEGCPPRGETVDDLEAPPLGKAAELLRGTGGYVAATGSQSKGGRV